MGFSRPVISVDFLLKITSTANITADMSPQNSPQLMAPSRAGLAVDQDDPHKNRRNPITLVRVSFFPKEQRGEDHDNHRPE